MKGTKMKLEAEADEMNPRIVSPQEWEDSPEGYPQTPPYKWWIWHDEPHRTDLDRNQ